MFQEKCTACDFPIEPGDKYLEAMGGIYHVECFTCSVCESNDFFVRTRRRRTDCVPVSFYFRCAKFALMDNHLLSNKIDPIAVYTLDN